MPFRPYYLVFLISISVWACDVQDQTGIDFKVDPQEPQLLAPGSISTGMYERDLAISPDGTEVIYTLGDYKQSKRCLVQVKKNSGRWTSPEILNISGKYQDIEPFFTDNATRLYFASNRPMPHRQESNDYNIWYTDRLENGNWGDPIPLDTIINTPGNEFYPSLSSNGNLYFTATRSDGIGREDIFLSKFVDEKFQAPLVLDSTVNTLAYEFNAYINPDEDLLIFSSFGRKDDLGGGDLYVSRKNDDGSWTQAQNMGEKINSNKLDYCPFIDWADSTFYFTSERVLDLDSRFNSVSELKNFSNSPNNGLGDLYMVKLDLLDI